MSTRTAHFRLGLALALAVFVGVTIGLGRGAAFAADGDLDYSFDGNGRVVTEFNPPEFQHSTDEARAVTVQPDGKIVAVGYTNWKDGTNTDDFALARYNPDGSPDVPFDGRDASGRRNGALWGAAGKVAVNFGQQDRANAVAIQADGKIVAVGMAQCESCYYLRYDFAAVRLNADGSADYSFGNAGTVRVSFSDDVRHKDEAYSVAIQADGKIVMAGYTTQGSVTNFALARLNPDGSLDNSFDGNGRLTTDINGGHDEARAVAIQPDGKIVAAGNAYISPAISYDFAVVRYNRNGSIDTTFSGDGKATVDFFNGDDGIYGMAIQPDGKIVAAGSAYAGSSMNYNFAFIRLTADGHLDFSFDKDGKQTMDLGLGGVDDARSVALQADGKIVAAGFAPVGGVNNFALARLNENGSLDGSFGGGDGWLTTYISYNDAAAAYGVAIQADGKIVAAGSRGGVDFALARYLVGGTPPLPPKPLPPKPLPPQPLPDVPPTSNPTALPTNSRYFAATGHTVSGLFLKYWDEHGGLAQQGYPITEELQEKSDTDGKVYTMQYFERAVFEYHPEQQDPNYKVLLSLLGVFYYNDKYGGNAPNQKASTTNPRYFPQTGKTIGGAFRRYWEAHGGLQQQGYPISDEFLEVSQTDGKTYTVQYFQRAVFEYHPEFAGTQNEVLLSLLGVFYDKKKHP